MKRFFPFLLVLFFASSVFGQQHLKFMGIPLNGSINEFTSKLQRKGFTISPLNKYASVGTRILEGRFFDLLSDVRVFYVPTTKNVFSARATMYFSEKKTCTSIQEEIENIIEYKYIYVKEAGKTKAGNDLNVYKIYHNSGDDEDYYYGLIYIGQYYNNGKYELNITYEDRYNALLQEIDKSEDI